MTANTQTSTTTLTTQAVDRLIAGIAKRNAGLLQLADRAALAIIGNPSDLAGRAVALLDAMSGIKAQRNLLAFFDDYLPNEVIEKKGGGFILGKKRPDWVEPTLPESGLNPTTYINAAKAALAKEERAKKVAETKAQKAEDAKKAQEAHNQRESDLVTRERELDSRIAAVHATANDRIGKAELATHDVKTELKAESDRLKVALSEKSRLERELAMANKRIADLESELTGMRQALAATTPIVRKRKTKAA